MGKPLENGHLKSPRRSWKKGIEMDSREIGCEDGR
jgi:hypothetical protein